MAPPHFLRGLILSAACLFTWSLPASAQTTSCVLPNWTIDDIKISFRNPSRANFTLHSTATGVSEAISCPLEFATLCEIRGTPNQKDLYIHLQTKNDDVWVNVTTPYTCDGKAGQVTGTAERLVDCAEDLYSCTAGQLVVNGTFLSW